MHSAHIRTPYTSDTSHQPDPYIGNPINAIKQFWHMLLWAMLRAVFASNAGSPSLGAITEHISSVWWSCQQHTMREHLFLLAALIYTLQMNMRDISMIRSTVSHCGLNAYFPYKGITSSPTWSMPPVRLRTQSRSEAPSLSVRNALAPPSTVSCRKYTNTGTEVLGFTCRKTVEKASPVFNH